MSLIKKGWLEISDSSQIGNTRFIASKTPICEEQSHDILREQRYTIYSLLEQHPNIGLVICLMCSKPPYNDLVFKRRGIQYHHIYCVSKKVEHPKYYRFRDVVQKFLSTQSEDKLICVHCYHGLNRTGYFICRYLIENMNYTAKEAIEVFERSRGKAMKKAHFKTALNLCYEMTASHSAPDTPNST